MLKIEDYNNNFNHTTGIYEFTPEEFEIIIGKINNNCCGNGLTENGAKILKCMQENCDCRNNIFKSKEIGELLFMAPRSISGSMKKLISENFIEKIGTNPVTYALTSAGKDYQFDNE